MGYIALVPARGGSKGIKNKNIVNLNGKPLIFFVLQALVNAESIDKIYVATDSDEISAVVTNEFKNVKNLFIYDRLPENAQDTSLTIDLVLEFLERCPDITKNDFLCLVQATSPLLSAVDIEAMLKGFEDSGAESALSCVETKKYHWTKEGQSVGHVFSERTPRQLRKNGLLVENGAVYLNRIQNIINEKCLLSGLVYPFIMDYDTIWEIDSYEDLEFVERLMTRKRKMVNL